MLPLHSVYTTGVVCLSTLHDANDEDVSHYEHSDERWRPIISVEALLMSVLAILLNPNPDSPANVEAAVSKINTK